MRDLARIYVLLDPENIADLREHAESLYPKPLPRREPVRAAAFQLSLELTRKQYDGIRQLPGVASYLPPHCRLQVIVNFYFTSSLPASPPIPLS